MKLLIDESVDRPIIDRLIDHGYDVLSIADIDPSITDAEVLQRANELSALLVTADKDFWRTCISKEFRRLRRSDINSSKWSIGSAQAEIVIKAFREYGSRFMQSFSVIGPGKVRIQTKP